MKKLFWLLVSIPLASFAGPELLQHRPYTKGTGVIIEQSEGIICHHVKLKLPVFDPVSRENVPVEFTVTLPRSSGPVPAVIITPSIEGVTIVEHSLAADLCQSNGMAAVIANVNGIDLATGDNALSYLQQVTVWGSHAVRTMMDYLEVDQKWQSLGIRSSIDVQRLGLAGISNGTVQTIFVAGVDPRPKAIFLAVGIGDIPGVLGSTNNEKLVDLREEQMEHFGLETTEDYVRLARTKFGIDPLDVAANIDTSKVLQVYTTQDTSVPTVHQEKLWQALGRPERVMIEYVSHIPAILWTVIADSYPVLDFFQDKLAK